MSPSNSKSASALAAGLFTLIAAQASFAQQPVAYRLEQTPVPDQWYVNDFNNQGIAVGHSRFTNGETVVLYDHFGVLGLPGKSWSLDELVTLPAYVTASVLDINNTGQFVAYLRNDMGQYDSILVSLFDSMGTLAPTWQYLNTPASTSLSYAQRVNDVGQVLGRFVDDASGETFAFILDSNLENAMPEVLTDPDPASGQPIPISNGAELRLNNFGQVGGELKTGSISGAYYVTQGFLLTPGVSMHRTPLDETIRTMNFRDMNDLGQLTGWSQLAVTSSGRKGKTTYSWGGVRYDELLGYDPGLLSTSNAHGEKINNSSDVLGYINTFDGTRESQFLLHGLDLLYLDDLVVGDADDMEFWQQATRFYHQHMNDRVTPSGFPEIFTRVEVAVTSGKGKNQVTTIETRFYMLTPELP